MTRAALALACLIACSGDVVALRIDQAMPAYGPLSGGARIAIAGAGFVAPMRVLVGGREAPVVAVTDATTLDVVLPPGDRPGDADVTVIAGDASRHATGIFHYTTAPAIDAIAPPSLLYTGGGRVTVTGAGFADEGAGTVSVLVDGVPANDVAVASDGALSFTAPPGLALVEPDLAIIDDRGTATRTRAFRYTPSTRGGLLLFATYAAQYATFYDPVDGSTVLLPRIGTTSTRYSSVMLDEHGRYLAADRSLRVGPIDFRTQALAPSAAPIASSIPAMVRVGGTYLVISRDTLRIGRLDLATGAVTPLSTTALPCCGYFGLAADGDAVWVAARAAPTYTQAIASFDLATGTVGTWVTLTGMPNVRIEDMRVFDHVLYATTTSGSLVRIDPTTGTVTPLAYVDRANAMEIVLP